MEYCVAPRVARKTVIKDQSEGERVGSAGSFGGAAPVREVLAGTSSCSSIWKTPGGNVYARIACVVVRHVRKAGAEAARSGVIRMERGVELGLHVPARSGALQVEKGNVGGGGAEGVADKAGAEDKAGAADKAAEAAAEADKVELGKL
jgi:hypothetical protein